MQRDRVLPWGCCVALILLRHTRPIGGEGVCYGQTDLPPGPDLAAEAQRLAVDLPPVTRIISSPLVRTYQLAQAIAAHLGLQVQRDARLAELDFGTWEGVPWDKIPRAELDAWATDLTGYRGHGGESVTQLYTRVSAALVQQPHGTLVVTHAGVIRAARFWAGLPDPWEFRLDYGAWIELP